MFHSLKYNKTSVLVTAGDIDCISMATRQDVVTLEIFLCLHIARSQQLAYQFRLVIQVLRLGLFSYKRIVFYEFLEHSQFEII